MTDKVAVEVPEYDTTSKLTVANAISLLRAVGIIVGPTYYLLGDQKLGVIILVVSGLTDWLDGQAARRLHQTSAFGAMLDPVLDKFFMLVTATLAGYMLWPSIAGLLPLVMIIITEAQIALYARKHLNKTGAVLKVVWVGKVGMSIRMTSVVLLLWSTTMDAGLAQAFVVFFGAIGAPVGFVFGMATIDKYKQQTAEAVALIAEK